MNSPNCIVVLGPTASGKTRLACQLAATLKGEIISLDSRQVYEGLNLGTGKDLGEYVVNGKPIPYHLIDICEPNQQFYLHDFIRELNIAFTTIKIHDHLPILCGGTGLYLDALRKDFSFTQIPEDLLKRKTRILMSKQELLRELDNYPENIRQHVDRNSTKRIIRGLEVADYLVLNKVEAQNPQDKFRPIYLGIKHDKEKLHQNIEKRLKLRLDQGLIAEAEHLLSTGISHARLQELGLEYKFLSFYLQGKIGREQLFVDLSTAIRQFAKRQMTWFRKMEKEGLDIRWIHPGTEWPNLISELKRRMI